MDELWVRLIEVEQCLSEIAQFEKIVGFFEALNRLRVNGADLLTNKFAGSIDEVCLGFVFFTTNAVVALIRALINKAGVIEVLQKLLHVLFVAGLSGANEVLVIDVDGLK